MFPRVFLAAILAGIAASLVMSAVQHFRVTPYILAAEVFESEAHSHSHAAADKAAANEVTAVRQGAEIPSSQAWAPAEGIERTLYTVLADLLVGIAFALCLTGASLLLAQPITLANGILWGLCGFMAFSLAPAAGLPPELPGMPAAELLTRQIWWWFTVAATAGGIALIAKRRSYVLMALGAAVIALPHVIGAPQPTAHESAVPAHLASGFAANALATAAVFWMVLGFTLGLVNERTSKQGLTHDAA